MASGEAGDGREAVTGGGDAGDDHDGDDGGGDDDGGEARGGTSASGVCGKLCQSRVARGDFDMGYLLITLTLIVEGC